MRLDDVGTIPWGRALTENVPRKWIRGWKERWFANFAKIRPNVLKLGALDER